MAADISYSYYEPVKEICDFKVQAKVSAGSVENLRKVHSGTYAMAVVYSGELYMGRNGLLKDDPTQYDNVLAVSYFYGAPAQLIVRKDSGVMTTGRASGLINPYLTTKCEFAEVLLHYYRKNLIISRCIVRRFVCSAIKLLQGIDFFIGVCQ